MKLERLLFGCVLGMVGVVALLLSTDAAGNSVGMAHPAYQAMRQGGDPARHSGVLLLGWAFGVLQILFFVGLLLLGARRHSGAPSPRNLMLAVGGVYVAAWTALLLAYRATMDASEPKLVLGFPPSTAILLYVLWWVPLAFAWIYGAGFGRYIFTPEDRKRFDALIDKRRNGGTG